MTPLGAPPHTAALLLLPATVSILFLAVIGGQASTSPPSCAGAGPPGATHGAVGDLDAQQMVVADQIVRAVRAFGPTANKPRAAVIALATARQESGIRNLDYGDRDSLGAFQQRPSQGWGSPAEVGNVPHATTTFLHQLIRVHGWETIRVTDAAATVQRPAEEFRGLYERWVPLATRLTLRLWGSAASVANVATVDSPACSPFTLVAAGSVVYPVPPALVGTNRDNWGGHGGHWSSWHTGTDFSVPCGTPVLAAHGGTIQVDRSQAWAGRWLVKVVTGPGSLTTWYAHMRKLEVHPGQTVTPGQPIGQAGDLGNATGCHLHFEVHLHNGRIYGPDNTDPTPWLAAHAGRARPRASGG